MRAPTLAVSAAIVAVSILVASYNRPSTVRAQDAKAGAIGRYQIVAVDGLHPPDVILLDTTTGKCWVRNTASNDAEGWQDWGSPFEAKR